MRGSRRDGPGRAAGPRAWPWAWAAGRRGADDSGSGGAVVASERERDRLRARWADAAAPARPLLRPAPRAAMFFPLAVLVAVLPGLPAVANWDLTPPGPWWGLRGLAVLDGHVLDQVPAAAEVAPALEAWAFRTVASQPPLYAWLEALGLALSSDRHPLAAVLPSYAAGALVVVLVYLHGRLWFGAGLGLVAAVLTGFNRHLLEQMQQATPTTLALAGVLAALWCYGAHLRRASGGAGPGPWGQTGPSTWGVLGGLALGLSLLSVGLFALAAVPVVLLHQAYLRAGASAPWGDRPAATRRGRPGPNGGGGAAARWRRLLARGWENPSLRAGALALAVAGAVALPWYVLTARAHGAEGVHALVAPLEAAPLGRPLLLDWLVRLAPASLPLGLLGAARAARRALADESGPDDPVASGGAFWLLWLAVGVLLPAAWPAGPRALTGLFLLVPLNLLAAQAAVDLAFRRIPVRTLTWLAPATAASVAWWSSTDLSGAVGDLLHGRADAATALGLHLALDLLVVATWLTRRLDRWARRRDDRQRRVLSAYLLAVFFVTVLAGAREASFRHRETDDLMMLRAMILRSHRERPFTRVDVVGPEAFQLARSGDAVGPVPVPGGRLRFILRSALPDLPQHDLPNTDALLNVPEADADGIRLVILAGRDQSLPYAVQSRLKLEAIHPGRSGVLDAFATARQAPAPRR